MQITSVSNPLTSGVLQEKPQSKNQESLSQEVSSATKTAPAKISEKSENREAYELPSQRETYGLMVLELMTDTEYQAFERATVGMTRGEKMIAAQSLYRLSELQAQNAKASFPLEQNSGYAKTMNFGDRFARALFSEGIKVDVRS